VILENGIYRPGPALPRESPFVASEAEAKALAIGWADWLEAIEVRRDGYVVKLEGVPSPEGEAVERIEPRLPATFVDMHERIKGVFNYDAEGVGQGLSPFWLKLLARMYFQRELGSKRKECFIRGGRRSCKSMSLCVVALHEALHGSYVQTADTSTFMFLSAQKPQAYERINTIRRFCSALKLGKETVDIRTHEVRFPQLNRQIIAIAANPQAVVSYTCFGTVLDEMALWGNTAAGADADTAKPEVILEQLKPTRITHKNAWLIGVSAPWSTLDLHYELFEKGTDEHQLTWHCPTWVGNPTVTEAETRAEERDEIKWRRQYAAIPLESDEQRFLPKPFIDRAWGVV
jgi:hypothetical protein